MRSRARALALVLPLLAACPRARREPDASLTLSVPYTVDTLDPHLRDRLGDLALASHLYEPLVSFDADLALRPALAVRWENPDALTWVFHLRSGVVFHSGKQLLAEDVVYTFERLRSDKSLDVGLYAVQIAGVTALDPLTVRIETRRPTAVLLNKLSSIFIVPKGSTGESLGARVDGTGPYRLVALDRGTSARLTWNPAYWGVKPTFHDATILLNRSPAAALDDLQSGRSQLAQVAKSAEEPLKTRPDLRLIRRTGTFLKYLGFDLHNQVSPHVPVRPNPFLSRAVREAISLAIDRRRLVGGLPSFALPASQIVPPFVFGFHPSLPELPHDPGLARSLLRGAGFPDGFAVTLHSRRIVGEAAPAIRQMLADVGIRVTVVDIDEATYFRMARERAFSFFLTRFACASGDVSDALDSAFHSIDESRHLGTGNIGALVDPALDLAIETSETELEMASRREKLHVLVSRIAREAFWVPLYFDQDVYALRGDLVFHPRADSFVLASEIGR